LNADAAAKRHVSTPKASMTKSGKALPLIACFVVNFGRNGASTAVSVDHVHNQF